MASEESHIEKIARIDANVQALLLSMPQVQQLSLDSAVNKREHKIALGMLGVIVMPIVMWVCKKMGIPLL